MKKIYVTMTKDWIVTHEGFYNSVAEAREDAKRKNIKYNRIEWEYEDEI